jgi:RNA polymerase sigma-70 factor (ECF subfamily)
MAFSLTRTTEVDAATADGVEPRRPDTTSTAGQRARVVDVLFERYRQRLLAFLTRLMASVDDAEDVVQDVYRRLLEVPALDDDEVRVRAFIFRIATNLAYDRFRARRVRGSETDLEEGVLADDSLDPDRIVGLEQCAAVIQQTLREIKPRCRQVFVLRVTEQLSYAQIATRLGVSTRTVERDIRYVIDVCHHKLKAE